MIVLIGLAFGVAAVLFLLGLLVSVYAKDEEE